MKTVGEIIHSERIKKDLTLERLSFLTKIDVKYLEALEQNRYDVLPSETFIKGFIRNVAHRLEKNPDELIAIFRRDYKHQDKVIPTKNISPKRIKLNFELSRFIPYLLGGLVFVVYLVFQFRAIITPPNLEIQNPLADSVLISPIEIEGTSSVDSQLSIGEDLNLRPDESGRFTAKLSLPIGETTLQIKSTNRFGRSTTKNIPITIISK